jgi:hypothetical protein
MAGVEIPALIEVLLEPCNFLHGPILLEFGPLEAADL